MTNTANFSGYFFDPGTPQALVEPWELGSGASNILISGEDNWKATRRLPIPESSCDFRLGAESLNTPERVSSLCERALVKSSVLGRVALV